MIFRHWIEIWLRPLEHLDQEFSNQNQHPPIWLGLSNQQPISLLPVSSQWKGSFSDKPTWFHKKFKHENFHIKALNEYKLADSTFFCVNFFKTSIAEHNVMCHLIKKKYNVMCHILPLKKYRRPRNKNVNWIDWSTPYWWLSMRWTTL